MSAAVAQTQTLASGVDARVLVLKPEKVSVAEGYRTPPNETDIHVARLLCEARLNQRFTPVPGPETLLSQPESVEDAELGPVDIYSERGRACLAANTLRLAPLFLLRSRAATIDENRLLANGNYFLFLRPDLDGPWNAYGDPIGLVMAEGTIDFPPQLPRACILFHDQQCMVKRLGFEQIQIKLANEKPVTPHRFGQATNSGVYTAYARCHGAIATHTPPAESSYDLAYLGRYPVAGRRGGGMPIPRAGCVIRLPDRSTALQIADKPLQYKLEGQWSDGIQAGPLIVNNGELTDQHDNVFASEHMTETPTLPDTDTVSPAEWCADWDTTRAARLGAGVNSSGRPIFIAVEGTSSTNGSGNNRRGATLRDLAILLQDEGVVDGLHLDGGGSTQVFGQAGGALISPADVHHRLEDRPAQYDRPIPTWLQLDL